MTIKSFATAILLASAPVAMFAAEKSPEMKGEAYFLSNEYDEPTTMMQAFSIALPDGLTEAQKKTVVDAVSEIMSVKPGREDEPIDLDDSFRPMTSEQVKKYAPVYRNNETDMSNWVYSSDVTPFETRMGVVAMQVMNYMYVGGAHGGTFIGYVNYNPSTDKVVTLDDYVKTANGKKALKNILYRKAKQEFGRVLFAQASDFPLASQYRITDDGITFVYQQYEIGPYAIGLPEYTVPFTTLKGLDSQQSVAPKRKTQARKTATRKTTRSRR